jgi:hypothetical protein
VGFFPGCYSIAEFRGCGQFDFVFFFFFFFFVQSFLVGTKIKRKWGEIRDKHRRV